VQKWLSADCVGDECSKDDLHHMPLEAGTAAGSPPLDINRVINEFNGNSALVMSLLEEFLQNSETQLRQLKLYSKNHEFDEIRKESHRIKGGSGNLTAFSLANAAAKLEEAARQKNLSEIDGYLEQLQQEFVCLKLFFSDLRKSNPNL
jgi:HPt (histidine-containing phosphotransfer) domain-containing protein